MIGQTWTVEIGEAEVTITVRGSKTSRRKAAFVNSRADPDIVALLKAFRPIFERALLESEKVDGQA